MNARVPGPAPDPDLALQALATWFAGRGWQPASFQRETWQAWWRGESGLVHAPTGSGKTLALLGGILAEAALAARQGATRSKGLRLLWITPMRALANDTARAIAELAEGLATGWQVGRRTGDTTAAERSRQARQLPEVLVITPESASLMLATASRVQALDGLQGVVVDEWHELMGSKRGVQVELLLAHLRARNPGLRTWGCSATLANLPEACQVLLGSTPGRLVDAQQTRMPVVDSVLPAQTGRFTWAGHLGLSQLPEVVARIEAVPGTLVFTSTRGQAERWYQAVLEARPEWAGEIAVHHGALDLEVRRWVEEGLRDGSLRAAICTSSLDLGVDFGPVAQVIQIGSPRGVARLAQRAGRSGHAPGQVSRVVCVPTHALELLEFAAARHALAQARIEPRVPLRAPLDVLLQHIATLACGEGVEPDRLLAEVRTTAAYADLPQAAWEWALAFLSSGGAALQAYPEHRRLVRHDDGRLRIADATLARRHRLSIGTIVDEGSVVVRTLRGAVLGQVEEAFAGRLARDDCFQFAGRTLQLIRVEGMTALVRIVPPARAPVARWWGGRMPLSSELAAATLEVLAGSESAERAALQPLLALQQAWSALPASGRLLAEQVRSREGWHLFLFPFAGRAVHGALATLLASALTERMACSIALSWNDHGLELLTATPGVLTLGNVRDCLDSLQDTATLPGRMLVALNGGELMRRHFREIARVAGLVWQGYPGARQSLRQSQVSSTLLYDVLRRFDPDNRLLAQCEHEVLHDELALPALQHWLEGPAVRTLDWREPPRVTPFAFPLLVDRWRERLSSESLAARVARMEVALERAAGPDPARPRRPRALAGKADPA